MNGKFPQFLFLLLLLAFASPMLGQNIIKGRVIDAETKDPLIGAAVGVESTSVGAMTQDDGFFELAVTESGQVSLLVTFVGYQDQRITAKTNGKLVDVR
ncbi:MAG: carboxypeptidase-like regulatory domain-containing protein, partial [Bacteroidota bacterium]